MLSERKKQLLNAILDELVPPNHDSGIPGAGALGVAEFILVAATYAHDPLEAVNRVLCSVDVSSSDFLQQPHDERVAILQQVEIAERDAFSTLVRLTYMGYYSRSDTRAFSGVSSQPVHPEGYLVQRESDTQLQALTAPVRSRGSVYRD